MEAVRTRRAKSTHSDESRKSRLNLCNLFFHGNLPNPRNARDF